MSVGAVLLIIIVIAVVVVLGATLGTYLRTAQADRRLQRRIDELEGLVDTLREISYTHRELDSNLASIITDEIRTFENRQRKELR